jgi:hypothetical protein
MFEISAVKYQRLFLAYHSLAQLTVSWALSTYLGYYLNEAI